MNRFNLLQILQWTCSPLLPEKDQKKIAENEISLNNTENFGEVFFEELSTDTRSIELGHVFLALTGDRFDGHDFIDQALEKGAALLILRKNHKSVKRLRANENIVFLDNWQSTPIVSDNRTKVLQVEDTLFALQQIACGYRHTLAAKIIAVTGSVGKTSTREMVSCCLSAGGKVHQTAANLNNEIGLPQTILKTLPDTDFLVLEMGMRGRGQIELLSKIACPDIAMITNIGWSHLELLGSRENILLAKTEIIAGMNSNGWLILNEDDKMLSDWRKKQEISPAIALVSVDKKGTDIESTFPGPVLWADDIRTGTGGSNFYVYNGAKHEVHINVPGEHHIKNVLMSLMTADLLNVPLDCAIRQIRKYQNTGYRQKIINLDNLIIMDDSYNASPESMLAALKTLAAIAQNNRKIAVLGSMKELGEYSEKAHFETGFAAAEAGYAIIFLIGEDSESVKKGAISYFKNKADITVFSNQAELIDSLKSILESGDNVLVKGSRAYAMENITSAIKTFWEEKYQ